MKLLENKSFNSFVKSFSEKFYRRGIILAWLILLISLFLTAAGWYFIKGNIEERARLRFSFMANETKMALKERLVAYEQVLLGARAFYNASDFITREKWRTYVSRLRINENYPGILGIGFSKVIKPEEKEKHIREIRSEGFSSYRIWPEYERDIYTSIIYLEPFHKRNQRAFGYDMFSESVRKAAMTAARDSAKIIMSGKVILVQETEQDVQNGFLMYVPVYKKNSDLSTAEKRKEALLGYVYSPFRMNDLMSYLTRGKTTNIDFSVYDGVEITAKSLMYQRSLADSQKIIKEPSFSSLDRLVINGRIWTLKYSTLPAFEAVIDREKPLIVLIGGILISALFFVVARTLTNTYMINRKLEKILESTMEGIYGINQEGKCTFINKAASQMLKYTPEECLGKSLHEVIHHSHPDGSPYPVENCPIMESIRNKRSCIRDTEIFWRSDGSSFPVEYSCFPIINGNQVTGAVITFADITERKKTMEQIETSLAEKEILLREIHHRVKNNLQIISSILNLQSYYITDNRALEAFNESKNRVRTMALIHEKLYRTESISRLNLREYVQELVSNLFKSYNTGKNYIQSEICVEEIFIVTEIAVPLGLIINEIVTNSLKHAFIPGANGKIYISIKNTSPEKLKIVIGDNGRGLPEELDYLNTDSLGLKLVSSLISQLEGEISLNKNGGTEYIILINSTYNK